MTIDAARLATDAGYWDEVAPEGATHFCEELWYKVDGENAPMVFMRPRSKWVHSIAMGNGERSIGYLIPRPQSEWVDGLPPESIAEFRKALAINLQNSIEAITGEAFSDDDSLILAHEMMVKYDLSEKLKFSGD